MRGCLGRHRQPGRLALEFTREANNAEAAVRSALADVKRAILSARLIEVAPDFVGLTDVAEIVGVSRQNMRKLMLAHSDNFPAPVHEGSVSIWHLAVVLAWLEAKGGYALERDMLEVAKVALHVNSPKKGAGQLSGRVGLAADQLINRIGDLQELAEFDLFLWQLDLIDNDF